MPDINVMKKNVSNLLLVFLLVFSHSVLSTDEPIIIGLDADLSAVAAEGGIAIQRGAEIAIDEINQAGGVLGRKLLLESRDHRGNPARGLKNIQRFAKKDNVVAVLGGVHTPVALHELPAIHEHKMIYLGPWAAGTPVVDNGYQPNYVFRLSVRDEHAGHVLLNHAKKRDLNKVGLLLEQTGWGRSNKKSMEAASNKLSVSIVGTEWFNWREKSMEKQIGKLLGAGAEAILLVSNAPEGAAIVKEMMKVKKAKRVPIISHWGIAGGAFVKMAGIENIAELDISILQTYSFLSPSNPEKMQSLLTAYQKKYNAEVTARSVPAPVGVVHAYDLVHILAHAIKDANTIDRAKVRDSLENLHVYNGVMKKFSPPFTKNKHDALVLSDYVMAKYDDDGYIVPVTN